MRRGYYTDNREDALIMWKDPARSSARDPRHRDVLRRDSAALVTAEGVIRSTSSPRRPICTRASAASCPRSHRAAIWSWSRPCREALDEAGATSTTSTPAVTPGPA